MVIAAAALCVVAMPPLAAERETRDLILNGTDPTLPAFLLHDAAMREALAKSAANRFQFFPKRSMLTDLPSPLRAGFLSLLRNKYKGRRSMSSFGIRTSVQFRTKAQERNYGRTLGASSTAYRNRRFKTSSPRTPMAGVITRRTVDKTVELARKLQPNALRLLVISGEPELEKEAVEMARGVFAEMPRGGICVWITAAGTASTGGTRAGGRNRRVLRPDARPRGATLCAA